VGTVIGIRKVDDKFSQWFGVRVKMEEGVKQFDDREYTLTNVPTYLRNATLAQGPCKLINGDTVTIKGSPRHRTRVYIAASVGNWESAINMLKKELGIDWTRQASRMVASSYEPWELIGFKTSGFQEFWKVLNPGEHVSFTVEEEIELSVIIRLEHECQNIDIGIAADIHDTGISDHDYARSAGASGASPSYHDDASRTSHDDCDSVAEAMEVSSHEGDAVESINYSWMSADPEHALVSKSICQGISLCGLYHKAGNSHRIDGLPNGTHVKVLEIDSSREWVLVSDANDPSRQGWVKSTHLRSL